MAALKSTVHEEAYEEVAEAFTYTTATTHPDWDLAYFGEQLADQITKWCAKLQANQPPAE